MRIFIFRLQQMVLILAQFFNTAQQVISYHLFYNGAGL